MEMSNIDKSTRRLNYDLITLIVGAVFIIPFVYSRATIDPVVSPRFLAWSILSFILALIIGIQARRQIDCSILHRAIFPISLCYLLVSLLSMVKSINPTESIFECLKIFLSFSFFMSSGVILCGNRNRIAMLIRCVVLCGLIFVTIGICQYWKIFFTAIPGNHTIYATMANKNLFASALFLMLPFTLFEALQSTGRRYLISLITLGGIFYCIAVTEARSVWVAVILSSLLTGSLVFVYFRNHRIKRKINYFIFKRIRWASFMIVIGVCAALIPRFIPGSNRLAGVAASNPAMTQTQIEIPASRPIYSLSTLAERSLLWKKSLRMAKENPILGVGPGQWKIVLPRYGKIEKFEPSTDGIREVIFQRPHNDFIWVLAETGLLGLVTYITYFLMLIFYAGRIAFHSEDSQQKIFAFLMLFGIIGYMLVSGVSFPKERIFHNIMLILTAACILGVYHRRFPIKAGAQHAKRSIAVVSILIFLMISTGFGYVRLKAEMHAKKALTAFHMEQWERVITEIDRVNHRVYSMAPVSTPLAWYRGMANYFSGRTRQALEDFKKASQIHPHHTHVLNNLGTCYALIGEYERAVACYQRALAISPHFTDARINLSSVNPRMKDISDAYRP